MIEQNTEQAGKHRVDATHSEMNYLEYLNLNSKKNLGPRSLITITQYQVKWLRKSLKFFRLLEKNEWTRFQVK